MTRFHAIYRIRNLKNGKVYVGSALNLFARWSRHRADLRANRHNNRYLQRAWNRHGAQAFAFEVVRRIENPLDLRRLEAVEIAKQPPHHRYNIAIDTCAPTRGRRLSSAECKKISRRMRATWKHPKTRKQRVSQIRRAWKSRHLRQLVARNSRAMWKKPGFKKKHLQAMRTVKHRKKLSVLSKQRWASAAYRAKMKRAHRTRQYRLKVNQPKYREAHRAGLLAWWAIPTNRRRRKRACGKQWRKKLRLARLRLWRSAGYRKKMVRIRRLQGMRRAHAAKKH